MVVYIDKSIGKHGKQQGLTEDEQIFFGALATGHQRGNCLICGELSSIEWLEQYLVGMHRAIYKRVKNKHYRMGAILSTVEVVTVLSYDSAPNVPTVVSNKARIINVQEAMDLRIDLQCSLVCENLDDCTFYELVAQRYMVSRKIKGINLSFHEESGGGHTICTVYNKCINTDKVFTLCLVDSDIKYGKTQKYPENPAEGGTVRAIRKVHNKLLNEVKPQRYELYTIPVHEVENLIPIAVLSALANSDVPEMQSGVAYLYKLMAAGLVDAILYYDFKHGYKKVKDDPSVVYWIEVAETICDDSLPGLCGKVLEKAIPILQGKTADKQNHVHNVVLDSYLIDIWDRIGLKVFSWGCANSPMQS